MAATKSSAVIVGTAGNPITQASSAAGSTYGSPSTGCQSSTEDISAAYEAGIAFRMTPGASVTTGCTMQVDIASDTNTNWTQFASVTSGLTSGQNYDGYIKLPDDVSKVRVTFFGNAGGAVGCQAVLSTLTGI